VSAIVRVAFAAALLAAIVSPSAAEEPATAPAAAQAPAKSSIADPDRIVCEKQTVVGSRLATKRVCKTRAQWADERLQERQEVERVQTRRGISAPGE
jgi:hypothetical protein